MVDFDSVKRLAMTPRIFDTGMSMYACPGSGAGGGVDGPALADDWSPAKSSDLNDPYRPLPRPSRRIFCVSANFLAIGEAKTRSPYFCSTAVCGLGVDGGGGAAATDDWAAAGGGGGGAAEAVGLGAAGAPGMILKSI